MHSCGRAAWCDEDFTADGWKYGVAVLEVADVQPVLDAADRESAVRSLRSGKHRRDLWPR